MGPGHGGLLLSTTSYRQNSSLHDLPWVPKGGFEQLLIDRRSSQETTWGKIKGTREAHQDHLRRDAGRASPAHTLILSETSPWNQYYKTLHQDLPGGAVVTNPPANAGDTGSSPGPHATEQLSPCATTTEPTGATTTEARTPRACAPPQKKPPQWEARAPRGRVVPALSTTRESPHSKKEPTQPKTKNKKNKKNPSSYPLGFEAEALCLAKR